MKWLIKINWIIIQINVILISRQIYFKSLTRKFQAIKNKFNNNLFRPKEQKYRTHPK